MILYALKVAEGYLKMADNGDFTLVGINKASVYPESGLEQLIATKKELAEELTQLRIIKLTLEESDFFA